ncbi:hypothetical protein LTR65_001280 [Meristemomyces frigidus]
MAMHVSAAPDEPAALRWEMTDVLDRQLSATTASLQSLSDHCCVPEATADLFTLMTDVCDLINAVTDLQNGAQALRHGPATASSAAKACEVFAIPELLEHIMLSVHPLDVLKVMQLNHSAYNTIANSMRLLRHMNLLPNEQSAFRSFFACARTGFTCVTNGEGDAISRALSSAVPGRAERPVSIFTVCAAFKSQTPPRLGPRVRSMLICQPPVHEMRIVLTCCNANKSQTQLNFPTYTIYTPDHAMEIPQPIRSATGITVGDIHDATCAMVMAHRLCPAAEPHEHDERGYVKVDPKFETTIRLREADPLLQARRQREREDAREAQRSATIDRYIVAKKAARDAEQPIPTLEEFEGRIRAKSEDSAVGEVITDA